MELSEKKSRSQFFLLLSAVRTVLEGMFGKKSPADRELALFYRSNRKCGSRDRALINSSLYTLLRYWGWVRKLAGSGITDAVSSASNRDLAAMLFFALFCDGSDAHKIRLAADFLELGALPGSGENDREKRAALAAEVLGITMQFSCSELLPEWTAGRLPESYAGNILKRPPMWLRVNRGALDAVCAELTSAGIRYFQQEGFPDALGIPEPSVNLKEFDGFRSGAFEVQDLASQAIVRCCAPGRGERWFDPCAGAGGKTLALAEAMGRSGTVVAGDVREKVLLELRKRARRAGYPNIMVRHHDGAPWRGLKPFDGVLIDAPCSCSGVWRRNPGNPWITSPEEVSRHAALQLEILRRFAGCVKPGGCVIYATCSAFREENEDVVQAFLAGDSRFELAEAPDPFTGEKHAAVMHVPESYDCDMMFAARLERKK